MSARSSSSPTRRPRCPPSVADERGIVVVPLQVVIGATSTTRAPTGRRRSWSPRRSGTFRPVSTSRPDAGGAARGLRAARPRDGATGILSIHLSGDMSGTFESAQLAARDASVPVTTSTPGRWASPPGYAVLGGRGRAGRRRLGATRRPTAARSRAAAASSLFYVDTLEYLRRGGRIGAAAALFGGALAVKPLLRIEDGRVATLEKVRTTARALSPARGPRRPGRRRPAGRRLRRPPRQPRPGGRARRPPRRAAGRQPRWARGLVRRAGRGAGRARRPRHARRLRLAAGLTVVRLSRRTRPARRAAVAAAPAGSGAARRRRPSPGRTAGRPRRAGDVP